MHTVRDGRTAKIDKPGAASVRQTQNVFCFHVTMYHTPLVASSKHLHIFKQTLEIDRQLCSTLRTVRDPWNVPSVQKTAEAEMHMPGVLLNACHALWITDVSFRR